MTISMYMTVALLVLLCLAALSFVLGYRRAIYIQARGGRLHSRPYYYGILVFLRTSMTMLLFLLLWHWAVKYALAQQLQSYLERLPATDMQVARLGVRELIQGFYKLSYAGLQNLPLSYDGVRDILAAKNISVSSWGHDSYVPFAKDLVRLSIVLYTIGFALSFVIALAVMLKNLFSISAQQRSRNAVEKIVQRLLLMASLVAILVTVGIVLSMFFQALHFFQFVSVTDFLFGTVWDPRFSANAGTGGTVVGSFGLLPLLAGTLYIALVAMFIAVPLGLFAAIYMAEYAPRRARAIIKPLLEILAGIPTIVYGFFALSVVGPFLRDLSAALAGGQGFILAQSTLTAGLVMGIMLIPYVSSLSDDVLTAVPRSLREGSLGLGGTQSETIRRVILPAAIPGISSALLLTASRAIGETMIVTLAAGVAPNLTWNPFEAMTTITVKIVSQLTGDTEFLSPQTLVAFALGLTLFILTLIMNIVALYISRKYQEIYE